MNLNLDCSYTRRLRRIMDVKSTRANGAVKGHTTQVSVSDRLVPTRAGNSWQTSFHEKTQVNNSKKRPSLLQCLVRNEVLNSGIEHRCQLDRQKRRVFHYGKSKPVGELGLSHSLSPLSVASQKLVKSEVKTARKVSPHPFRQLEAPEIARSFYCNILDWSSQDVIAVALGPIAYWWLSASGKAEHVCELKRTGDCITSVSWSECGDLLSLGTLRGTIHVFDVKTQKEIECLNDHSARIGVLAWNGNVLSSGSRDALIVHRDIRQSPATAKHRIRAHSREVCGLKWSPDGKLLASGGKDNQLLMWDPRSHDTPLLSAVEHSAAVKAIGWSPHHRGILASGVKGHQRISFWNVLTDQVVGSVDTGSQVCNLAWSKDTCQLVTTHGHDSNDILVWDYPSLAQVGRLSGHSQRVLHLATSPHGQTIATGASDEIIKFWRVFDEKPAPVETRSPLNLFTSLR